MFMNLANSSFITSKLWCKTKTRKLRLAFIQGTILDATRYIPQTPWHAAQFKECCCFICYCEEHSPTLVEPSATARIVEHSGEYYPNIISQILIICNSIIKCNMIYSPQIIILFKILLTPYIFIIIKRNFYNNSKWSKHCLVTDDFIVVFVISASNIRYK